MNDFTKEDCVYAFQFPEDGCGGFDIAQVELNEFCKSKNIGAGFMQYAFDTKQEALEAMRKRLIEIENE